MARQGDARVRSAADCPKAFSKFAPSGFSKNLNGSWSRYNRVLVEKVGPLASPESRQLALEKLRSLLSDFSEIYPELLSSDFLVHVEAEWKAGLAPAAETSWSEFLQQSYARFLERYRSEADLLYVRSSEWADEARLAVEKCSASGSCAELSQAPASLLKSVRERVAGTCLGKSPSAAAGLARELALSWSVIGGYFAANSKHTVQEFPFAFFINSTVWSWIFAEKHCLHAVAAGQKLPLGKPIHEVPRNAWGQVKKAVKEEVADWVWVPAMATSSIGFSLWADYWLEKNRSADFYQARWSYLVIYNAASGPIRRVLVLDPVFQKAFPALGVWADRMVRQGRLAQITTKTTELGVDYGLRWGEWEIWGILYNSYMKSVGVSTK